MTDERVLIAKARNGDAAALNALAMKYWQPIYRLACYKVGNPDDAQEITQETFLKAFRSIDRYQEMGASFKTYLGRITVNLINDFWRKQGRTPQVIDISGYTEPLEDTGEKPEDSALSAERQHEIKKLVCLLPEEQRRAVELRIIEGRSVQETARLMGKTEPAIKMLQQRALKNLRRIFLEHGITG